MEQASIAPTPAADARVPRWRNLRRGQFVRQMKCLFLGVVLAATLTGCSSFEKAWEKADADAPAGIGGRWSGRWMSNKNLHNGELRCIVSELTNGLYSARFHARFKVGFNMTYNYTVILDARPRDHEFDFHGSANLGWYAGGRYVYNGYASATNFHSTYSCKWDHGFFEMKRP